MAIVADLLAKKGAKILSIGPSATVLEAVKLMNRHKIGALVVTSSAHYLDQEDPCDHVIGMFTERDVLMRVVGCLRDAEETPVQDVMTEDVAFCKPQDDLDSVAEIMRERRIRHVPVCDDDGQLHGLVSIGDLNAWRGDGQEATINYLNDYIQGRA
jgi:CBS domain-containing protein